MLPSSVIDLSQAYRDLGRPWTHEELAIRYMAANRRGEQLLSEATDTTPQRPIALLATAIPSAARADRSSQPLFRCWADHVAVMTRSPGRIKAVYDIRLSRLRARLEQLRFQSDFLDLHRRLWHRCAMRSRATVPP